MGRQALEDQFAHWVVRHPWQLIVSTFFLFFLSAFGLNSLQIDSDLRVFFGKDNPRLLELEAMENIYAKHENVVFIVVPQEGEIFTPRTLQVLIEMTAQAWQMPFSSAVYSLTNYQYSYARGDELVVADFITGVTAVDPEILSSKREIALHEPAMVNRLISTKGDVAGINVNVIFREKNAQDVAAVADFARNLAADFTQRYPFLRVHVSGSVMFDTAFSEVGQNDVQQLAIFMFLILVIIVGIALRSWMATLLISVTILFSTATAMGIAGWLGISINPASANAPTIILTLAVADSVHILVTYYHQMYNGAGKVDALVKTLKVNLQAVFLTSVTTVIGFLTMNFSDAPPFHDLGNIVALGVLAALIYSVFLLPALLVVLPDNARFSPISVSSKLFASITGLLATRSFGIILGMIATATILGVFALQNRLNDNWIKYFSEHIPLRVATDIMEVRLTGSDFIEYSIAAGEPGGINDPEYLRNLDDFARWLRAQPIVENVLAISDVLKRLNKNMHADDSQWYRIPESRELAAQYLLLYEMNLPQGLDLNDRINVDKSASRVVIIVKNHGTAALRKFDSTVQQWLRENTPQYMHSRGTGLTIVWANISENNIRSMLVAAFGALFLISIILFIALRRVDMGLISLIPNILPAVCAFGLWGLIVGEIGLGLSVVVSMTLGIVVDDTVHFVSKYVRARDVDKLQPLAAIQHTFQIAGSAMLITTVALVAGFLVLTLSDYKMSADMGLLSAATIAIALLLDFLLLPALLLRFDCRVTGGSPQHIK